MEGTPRLINNWQYAEAPSPQAILSTGISQAVAPVNQAVENYIHHQQDIDTMRQHAALDERLQALRLDAVAKNVSARDASLLQIKREADDASAARWAGRDKQRSDAITQQGLNQALKAEQQKAAAYGTPEPTWKGTGPNGSITPQDVAAHVSDWSKANEAMRSNHIATGTSNLTSLLHDQDQITAQTAAYASKFPDQAKSLVMAKTPISTWVSTQDQNSKQVKDYNAAIESGQGEVSAARTAGLLGGYSQYVSGMAPLMSGELLKLNANNDPAAKQLLERDKMNQINQQLILQGRKGEPLDYADEIKHGALLNYANDHAAALKDIHDKAVSAGEPPNHPAIIAAATNAKNQIIQKQQQLEKIAPTNVTIDNSGLVGVAKNFIQDAAGTAKKNISDSIGHLLYANGVSPAPAAPYQPTPIDNYFSDLSAGSKGLLFGTPDVSPALPLPTNNLVVPRSTPVVAAAPAPAPVAAPVNNLVAPINRGAAPMPAMPYLPVDASMLMPQSAAPQSSEVSDGVSQLMSPYYASQLNQ